MPDVTEQGFTGAIWIVLQASAEAANLMVERQVKAARESKSMCAICGLLGTFRQLLLNAAAGSSGLTACKVLHESVSNVKPAVLSAAFATSSNSASLLFEISDGQLRTALARLSN